ncbi:MAG: cytidine deaminase [Eubacteriales bacterium]|nr:cytidine deaminase [Eubacteriales bacterium]
MEEKILTDAGIVSVSDETLLAKAKQAMQNAYVPYSKYKVGACLLTADGKTYTGCNIENASYGLTNCAERTAVFKAVSDGEKQFVAIAIAAEENAPWPCGACRQVLSEFAEDMRVLVTWKEDQVKETTLKELLPYTFSPSTGVLDFLAGN